jgi:hypothetical protein
MDVKAAIDMEDTRFRRAVKFTLRSFGLRYSIVWWVVTVSKKHTASLFRVRLKYVLFMLFISVHMIDITKHTQLTHNFVYLFIFYLSSPRHVSASNYAIIKGAVSKLHKMCMNVTTKYERFFKKFIVQQIL